ncbi:MAG: DUF4491 family protein [Muribaculaceae bacterium]|nr:DUF4491 family protein [Muribaculaceae bacterium]
MIAELLSGLHFDGLLVGLATFLIIGVFHPLVIKGEYYFGSRCRRWFLWAGIVMCVVSLIVSNTIGSILAGVVAFSCFWSIKEVDEQVERVRKGWFPRNPKRVYPFDDELTAGGDPSAARKPQPKQQQR